MKKLPVTKPFFAFAIAMFVSTIVLTIPGCGDSPVTTDQDEITRFLEENPEAQNSKEEASNLKSDEYKGIVRTPEKV
tara:strand:- start:222 stop:452 length:231 start_codon:yes stop_codon:yes gene_type:complete